MTGNVPRRRPLVEQLKASSCQLCQLAAEEIEQLRNDHAADLREMQQDLRAATAEAYQEGRASERDY